MSYYQANAESRYARKTVFGRARVSPPERTVRKKLKRTIKDEALEFQKIFNLVSSVTRVLSCTTIKQIAKLRFIGIVSLESDGVVGRVRFGVNYAHDGDTVPSYHGSTPRGFSVSMNNQIRVIDIEGDLQDER